MMFTVIDLYLDVMCFYFIVSLNGKCFSFLLDLHFVLAERDKHVFDQWPQCEQRNMGLSQQDDVGASGHQRLRGWRHLDCAVINTVIGDASIKCWCFWVWCHYVILKNNNNNNLSFRTILGKTVLD